MNEITLPPGTLVTLSKPSGLASVAIFERPDYLSSTVGFLVEGELANVVSMIEVKRLGLTLKWAMLVISDGTMGWTDRIEYLQNAL